MATTMEIVNGISQVMANSYDGALDEKGEPIKVGLKREEGHPINDSRVMDGFNIAKFIKKEYKKITGNALSLKSSGDCDAVVETTSRHRCWVEAYQYFDISGEAEAVKGDTKDSVDAKFKDFLEQGGWKKAEPQGQPIHVGDGKVQSRKDINSPFKNE